MARRHVQRCYCRKLRTSAEANRYRSHPSVPDRKKKVCVLVVIEVAIVRELTAPARCTSSASKNSAEFNKVVMQGECSATEGEFTKIQ